MPVYEFEINGTTYEVEADQRPSAAQMRSVAARMGQRKPADPDDFTDRPNAPAGSSAGRFTRGAWEMVNPVTIAQGLYGVVRHPIDTGKALVGAQLEQFDKAGEAFRAGRYSEAVGHGAAGVLPVLGPVAANVGEQIGSGDVAGGLGAATGLVAPVVAAKPVAAAVKRGAQQARAAVRGAVTAAPDVADAARWALAEGVPVDVATVTGNRVVSGAKNLADRTLGGTFVGDKAARMRAESMAKLGRKLSDQSGPAATTETAGAGVRGTIEGVIREQAGKADDAYGRVRAAERAALPDDVPVSRPVAPKIPVEEGFIGHWLADDLQEMGYQAGGVTRRMAREAYENWQPGDGDAARYGVGKQAARVAGTPTLQMFHDAGITGSRAEIADRLRRVLNGTSNDQKITNLLGAMREAWDGQRFDWQLVSDERMATTGLKRSQMKSPITMPAEEIPGFERMFFGDKAGVAASATEPMQLAVPLQGAKDALRPVFERLQRKKELTGQLMGDEGRAATALDAILSGPDHAPLSVVDAALGDLKRAASGAALPELRTSGQGLAAQAVKELEALVQQRAKAAGVWDDLRAGRDATIAKWTAADTLKALREEPVQAFRDLTQNADTALEKLRDVQKIAPGELRKVGRAYLDTLLDTATAEGGFGREARLWADWQKLGDGTKALLYPDAELRSALDKFFLIGKKMAENPNPSGTSYVAGIGAQGGLLVTEPVSGAATVLGGAALSKALNSPKVARLLLNGMETRVTAPAARSLAARLRVALRAEAPRVAPGVVQGREMALASPSEAQSRRRP